VLALTSDMRQKSDFPLSRNTLHCCVFCRDRGFRLGDLAPFAGHFEGEMVALVHICESTKLAEKCQGSGISSPWRLGRSLHSSSWQLPGFSARQARRSE
jgi:hypothetical protein